MKTNRIVFDSGRRGRFWLDGAMVARSRPDFEVRVYEFGLRFLDGSFVGVTNVEGAGWGFEIEVGE